MRTIALSLSLLVLAGCCSKAPHELPSMQQACAYAGDEAGLRAFVGQFLTHDDRGGLTLGMRPTREDYDLVFVDDVAKRVFDGLEPGWDDGEFVFAPHPSLATVELFAVTPAQLAANDPLPPAVPDEYRRLTTHLRDDVTVHVATFRNPETGEHQRLEGIVRVGSCWRLFPRAWTHL